MLLTSNTLLESDLSFKYRHGPKIRPGARGWLPQREAFEVAALSCADGVCCQREE